MFLSTQYIVYPEGDKQEINHSLRINQIVTLNGVPVNLPLTTIKTIAYRVIRISRKEERHEENVFYHLELLNRNEMMEFF